MNARNIQEYVVAKVIEHLEYRDEEIKNLKIQALKKDKEIKYMKELLTTNRVCYECKCSRCDKFCVKLPFLDKEHFHDAIPEFPVLCYNCFFTIL